MPDEAIALNLAKIVQRLLIEPRGWRVDSLQRDLGIKPRTYRKYRQLLRERFPPWRHRGNSLLEEVREGDARFLRLVPRGDAEPGIGGLVARLTAYRLARELFASLGEHGLKGALDDAFRSFWLGQRHRRLGVLSRLQRDLDRLVHYVPDAPKDYSEKAEILEPLLQALVYRKRVQLRYRTPGKELASHELEPLTVALWRGGLYLFARYRDQAGLQLRHRPIEELDVLSGYFTYPTPQEYDPARTTRDAFGIFFQDRGKGRTVRVDLRFESIPWLHAHLRERTWHKTQKIHQQRDGRLRLTFSVGSLEEVVPWVRGFGTSVVVVAPKALRDAVSG